MIGGSKYVAENDQINSFGFLAYMQTDLCNKPAM